MPKVRITNIPPQPADVAIDFRAQLQGLVLVCDFSGQDIVFAHASREEVLDKLRVANRTSAYTYWVVRGTPAEFHFPAGTYEVIEH